MARQRRDYGNEQQIETLHDAGLTVQQIARATILTDWERWGC